MYVTWARVLGHDFEQLVREAERHHRRSSTSTARPTPPSSSRSRPKRSSRSRVSCAATPGALRELQQFYRQDPAAAVSKKGQRGGVSS